MRRMLEEKFPIKTWKLVPVKRRRGKEDQESYVIVEYVLQYRNIEEDGDPRKNDVLM